MVKTWTLVLISTLLLVSELSAGEVKSALFRGLLSCPSDANIRVQDTEPVFKLGLNTIPSLQKDDEKDIRKRQGNAFLKSLLIPGWGQLSQGRRTVGYAFIAAEISLLSSIIGLRTHAGWLEDDFKTFASQHAGVSGDWDRQYYIDIGNWMDRRSFNEERLRDRQFDRMYNNPAMDWTWDTDENRSHFKDIRISSDQARQRAVLFVGAVILNHLISSIEAGKSTGKNKVIGFNSPDHDSIVLSLSLIR